MSSATVSINKRLTSDGTLLSIGGTDADDFLTNVRALLGSDSEVIAAFEQAFKGAGSFEQAAANVTNSFPEAQPPPEQQWRQASPPAAAPRQGPPPGTSAPTCDHGQPREWKTGTNKTTQKPWKGWFCKNPNRDAQCAPSWVR